MINSVSGKSTDNWSEEELEASVRAYLEMRELQDEGQKFVKKRYYEKLSQSFDRTTKAFEYRMQNISYVFTLMGRNWVTGLKPAKIPPASSAALFVWVPMTFLPT